MTGGGPGRATYLVTGIQAAGKSSVAQALAARLPAPAVHVHGDQFRRWVVSGRADMTPDPTTAAVEQLRLRHRLTAVTCDGYAGAGFSVVAQDVILGSFLAYTVGLVRARPLHVVVLAPRPGRSWSAGPRRARPPPPPPPPGAGRSPTGGGPSSSSTPGCGPTRRGSGCGSTRRP